MKSFKGSSLAKVGVVAILISLTPFSRAQPSPQSSKSSTDTRVLVSTWKRGNGTVQEQTVRLSLKGGFEGYEFGFSDSSEQRHFRLSFQPSIRKTLTRPNVPCWSTDLREVTADIKFGGNTVGFDLLSPEGPGVGHNFPREGLAGVFCPIEKPNPVLDGQFYSLKAERVFLIERFLLSLRATDYQNDKKENALNKLDITIELKNQ